MKTPTWATVIGICMIVVGGCSVMNDIKSIRLPEDLERAMTIIKKKQHAAKTIQEDSIKIEIKDSLFIAEEKEAVQDSISFFGSRKESLDEVLKLTDFTRTWIVRFGYIGVASACLYILGGVFLLVRKRFSITLAYGVLIVSILTSGAQAAVLTSGESSGLLALTTGLGQLFGILIDIILVAVIFASDKEAYTAQNLS